MLSVNEALSRILAHAPPSPTEEIPVERAAGRILRETIATARDLPPFDRATMDGIVIAHAAFAAGRREFVIAGIQAAGQPALALNHPESDAIEIMTGAMRPDGSDTIIPYEEVEIANGRAQLAPDLRVERGQFFHRQGEDRKAGDTLLESGTRLLSPQIAIAISTGASKVVVAKSPSFAVISVGDEIVAPGNAPERFQIHPSNAWGIRAALQGLCCPEVELATLPDKPDVIEQELARLLSTHDGMILSGGVSRGKFDFVPAALERLGVVVDFHRVSQKPGAPMWFGNAPGGKPVFALPGNPVSTMVCFHRYVKPYLLRSLGAPDCNTESTTLLSAVKQHERLTLFLPVRRSSEGARLQEYHGSGDYSALGESTGFIEIPKGSGTISKGHSVRYHSWGV